MVYGYGFMCCKVFIFNIREKKDDVKLVAVTFHFICMNKDETYSRIFYSWFPKSYCKL